jgi:hypothetical protein
MGAIASRFTPNRIQKHYRVSKTSTIRIVQNALIRHNDESKSRFKRPKKLLIRDERHILRIVWRDFKIIYKNLAKKFDVSVSHNTLYRLLKEKKITNWLCKKRPLLTSKIAGKRYAWKLRPRTLGFWEVDEDYLKRWMLRRKRHEQATRMVLSYICTKVDQGHDSTI